MSFLKLFDDRLKKLRIDKKLSMRQVALAIKIPYTTYVSYEKNEREPNSETLITLANFFDCSIDYLIGHSNQVKMLTLDEQNFNLSLSAHEKNVINAYKSKPEMQPAVDKLLGVSDDEMVAVPVAARSESNRPVEIMYIPKEKLELLENTKSVEDEVDL